MVVKKSPTDGTTFKIKFGGALDKYFRAFAFQEGMFGNHLPKWNT